MAGRRLLALAAVDRFCLQLAAFGLLERNSLQGLLVVTEAYLLSELLQFRRDGLRVRCLARVSRVLFLLFKAGTARTDPRGITLILPSELRSQLQNFLLNETDLARIGSNTFL